VQLGQPLRASLLSSPGWVESRLEVRLGLSDDLGEVRLLASHELIVSFVEREVAQGLLAAIQLLARRLLVVIHSILDLWSEAETVVLENLLLQLPHPVLLGCRILIELA